MTLSLRGYTPGENAWTAEGHYSTASTGQIDEVREDLRDTAFPHFRSAIRRFYGIRISGGEIKAKLEPEQPALAPSDTVHVDILEMIYRGKQHYSRQLASEDIPFKTYEELLSKSTGSLPYRHQIQLNAITEALAVIQSQAEVTQEHIDTISWLVKWINYDFNEM
jgi:hypothetical protein